MRDKGLLEDHARGGEHREASVVQLGVARERIGTLLRMRLRSKPISSRLVVGRMVHGSPPKGELNEKTEKVSAIAIVNTTAGQVAAASAGKPGKMACRSGRPTADGTARPTGSRPPPACQRGSASARPRGRSGSCPPTRRQWLTGSKKPSGPSRPSPSLKTGFSNLCHLGTTHRSSASSSCHEVSTPQPSLPNTGAEACMRDRLGEGSRVLCERAAISFCITRVAVRCVDRARQDGRRAKGQRRGRERQHLVTTELEAGSARPPREIRSSAVSRTRREETAFTILAHTTLVNIQRQCT